LQLRENKKKKEKMGDEGGVKGVNQTIRPIVSLERCRK